MKQYIDKVDLVSEIKRKISLFNKEKKTEKWSAGASQMNVVSLCARIAMLEEILSFIDTIEVKEVDLDLKIDNNNPKITIGTKIRSKTNPDIILSIISNDCHDDEFECSNGSVLSLKQIEKYYDIII